MQANEKKEGKKKIAGKLAPSSVIDVQLIEINWKFTIYLSIGN